jgi:ankyrin repeat protein
MSDLKFLRKEAKLILKQCRAGDDSAIVRICAQLPQMAALEKKQLSEQIKLADVHHALARERGYVSWAKLKHTDEPLERFLAAIRGGALPAARQVLSECPDLGEGSIHAACALGDLDEVVQQLGINRELATNLHAEWPPILYACASPFNRLSARHATGIIQCVAQLLEHGADPNTYTVSDPTAPDRKISAWYRAVISGNIPLSLFLGNKGARPAESAAEILKGRPDAAALNQYFTNMFGTPESRDRMKKVMEELKERHPQLPTMPPFQSRDVLERYASPEATMDRFRGLLDSGYDPNQTSPTDGTAPLHNIVVKSNSAGLVEMFLSHGADPNLPRGDGKTPYTLAARAGNTVVMEILKKHGASADSTKDCDLLIGACINADLTNAQTILLAHPDIFHEMNSEDLGAFINVAGTDNAAGMKVIAQLGFDLSAFGESGATALHIAAWNGRVEMVSMLLDLQAPIGAHDKTYDTSPLAWAAHGSKNCRDADEEYICIVEALFHVGADWESAVGRGDSMPEIVASPKVALAIRNLGRDPRH